MPEFELGEHFSKDCDQAAKKVSCIRNKTSLGAFVWEVSELHFVLSEGGFK